MNEPVTKSSLIAEPDDVEFSVEDFKTSTDRARSTRQEVLARNAKAAEREKTVRAQTDAVVSALREVRKARGLTQTQLAAEMGVDQAEVSRIEHRDNLHLQTLIRFIEATGGEIKITVSYGDQEVELSPSDLSGE